jgi:extracellular factor (EF) 3-hydroxypalmitic acid methyl ester biosynthesis protein
VNMMFRDPCEGGSLFAKIINTYALSLPPIEGHRKRVLYLAEQLQAETLRAVRAGRKAKIFNIGCGPAHEIQRFLAQTGVSDQAQFTLVDFNDETLVHLGKTLEALKRQYGRQTSVELKKKSVHQLLKEAAKVVHGANGSQFDFAYCAGLFDYLPDRVCRQLVGILYQMLAPGGLLVVTNVDRHPSRGEMECFLEWHLVYRNAERLAKLAPEQISPELVNLKCDNSTGVNVFLELRKPEHV